MPKDILTNWEKKSGERQKEYKKFLHRANKNKVLKQVPDHNEEAFEKIDCLTCANCCKTTSPILYQNDIERLSKSLRMKPGDFIEQYLRVDEDHDYVLKSSPCPFLGSDNYCSVYENRPRACREYPHTHRKKMVQIMDLTFKNTFVCPAVFEIVERLKKLNF